jgi:galactofuranosylgalactofuranosylrhamnosyl-N-acetylglucosaminyl-diphospho-decaprenol beta-1,5/1,6-galactofuranosyltransferase
MSATTPASAAPATVTRTLQRVVLPLEADQDILPLYVEGEQQQPLVVPNGKERGAAAEAQDLSQVLSRTSYAVRAQQRTSFGTYFNAFPASYWRRWTVVTEVTLRVTVLGEADVIVYRSNAKGNVYRVDSTRVDGGISGAEVTFDLPLSTFADGGWYWFDVIAADGGATVKAARWEAEVPEDRATPGTLSIAVTTLNRPDDVVALLGQHGADPELLSILDEVIVVDQGSQHPTDAEGFAEAEKGLDGRLRVIIQANLGGSGGFSRGMSETLDAEKSTYVLISDDDVRTEPEGIVRAATFADLSRRPTIVGGQMFSMFDRPYLHSMGERIQPWRFWWGPVLTDSEGHHLDKESLRSTRELHRRVDVDYNGWWMTLIPLSVVREIGLSLPLFIKWDDAEYSLRARQTGVPTVTLPGAAVWHVPWTDKDDTLDWQAYYHERNRFVAALLHSQYPRGGRLVRESFIHQTRHLLASQYSVAELRLMALEDLLSGPEHMHDQLGTRLADIRAVRAAHSDSSVEKDPGAFPAPRREKMPKKGEGVRPPSSRAGLLKMAAVGAVKQLRPIRPLSTEHPEAEVHAADAKWWMLSQFDSAVVSTSDGSGASWYHRDPQRFRDLMSRSVKIHEQLLRAWPELSEQYKGSMESLVGQDEWKKTFRGER